MTRITAPTFLVLAFAAGGFAQQPTASPLASFKLPEAWAARFWADPAVKKLLELDAKALAALVPVQAGIRHCRCPACTATEADDPLTWSLERPDVLTCRRCGATIPSETIPAKVDGKVPEEAVEVLPGEFHHYPFHVVEPHRQAYPDERVYLAAKRDDEIRAFLAKSALYAAVRYSDQPAGQKDERLARLSCTLLLRFAQVYPAYSVRYDQPGRPKYFDKADLQPPYRRGYQTTKWDWGGNLGVPLNLVIAYAVLRDSPGLAEAGRLLGDRDPRRTIERDLFHASATFVRNQPEEFAEASLAVYRGLLAVGRLLADAELVHDAVSRLAGFAERGFYHDGMWHDADPIVQRRVVGQIDGWIDRLLAGYSDPSGFAPSAGRRFDALPGAAVVPMLGLARVAESAVHADPRTREIQLTSWPAPAPAYLAAPRRPVLLGGAGLARLVVGAGNDAIALDLRGLGDLGARPSARLALRLSIDGTPVLGDLDDGAPSPDGWELSTAAHNDVTMDGLNQRESPVLARAGAPGADVRFFAADPDFQIAVLDDRFAYPSSASRYRHTVAAVAAGKSRYAVSVFEASGGLQHDQLWHAAAGTGARWRLSTPVAPGPESLLPAPIVFLARAKADEGRWFVQSYGEFAGLAHARLNRPTQAVLERGSAPGVRLHLLADLPMTLFTATSRDRRESPITNGSAAEPGRAALIVRRRHDHGATLDSQFVTVLEPLGQPALLRVGRVASERGTVVLVMQTADGDEHLVLNLASAREINVALADGERLRTDALAVRVTPRSFLVAGGTFAELGQRRHAHHHATGRVVAVGRDVSGQSRGWFQTDRPLPEPRSVNGRALRIRHDDGTTRGWTIDHAENQGERGARIYVREEPGWQLDAETGFAFCYQFPGGRFPGPHAYAIDQITR
jgi:hypothetical protein